MIVDITSPYGEVERYIGVTHVGSNTTSPQSPYDQIVRNGPPELGLPRKLETQGTVTKIIDSKSFEGIQERIESIAMHDVDSLVILLTTQNEKMAIATKELLGPFQVTDIDGKNFCIASADEQTSNLSNEPEPEVYASSILLENGFLYRARVTDARNPTELIATRLSFAVNTNE